MSSINSPRLMPNKTKTALSVAEAFELPPGDEQSPSWLDAVSGAVRSIEPKESRAGKKFWKIVLGDLTGSAELEFSMFTAPKFQAGAVIELREALRRTEYNGIQQIALAKKSEIHVVGQSVHHEEQQQRHEQGQMALDGTPFTVPGVTVGMTIKEALEIQRRLIPDPGKFGAALDNPEFWLATYILCSDIIRLSRMLEHGKLAPPVKERLAGAGKADPAPKATGTPSEAQKRAGEPSRPQSGPLSEQAKRAEEASEVPF